MLCCVQGDVYMFMYVSVLQDLTFPQLQYWKTIFLIVTGNVQVVGAVWGCCGPVAGG